MMKVPVPPSLRQFVTRTRRFGWESYQLGSALIRTRSVRKDDLLPVVMLQAQRESNNVAVSLLNFHKQIGLVRYYGILGYLEKEKNFTFFKHHSSRNINSQESTDVTISKQKGPKTARVAFMITATQRTELVERLGYETDQIKRLTPIQASLALKHDIEATDDHDTLKTILDDLQEKEELEELKAQQEMKDHQRTEIGLENKDLGASVAEAEVNPSTNTENLHVSSDPHDSTRESNDVTLLQSSSLAADSTDGDGESSSSSEGFWFEIVETHKSESTVIALYDNVEEAQLCLDTKRGFASKRKEKGQEEDYAPIFEMRRRPK